MAARRIRQVGDPILRVRCTPVQDPKSPAVRLLADDLRDTLRAARKKYNMGRALAAPQIGAPVRVVLVEIGKFRATMVNPEITDVGSEDFHVWDDCFSFPNLLVRVTRAYRATLRYTDMKGKVVTMELEGPMAELLQHELDHLDGILALDQPSGQHCRQRRFATKSPSAGSSFRPTSTILRNASIRWRSAQSRASRSTPTSGTRPSNPTSTESSRSCITRCITAPIPSWISPRAETSTRFVRRSSQPRRSRSAQSPSIRRSKSPATSRS